jgi:eukaryotic-like serine/threonine-protein kinase
MRSSLLSKPALVAAAGAALAGLCTMAGTAGAATRTVPAAHRGTAPQAGPAARRQAAGFSNWPMFRDGPAHLGVSPETAISAATAGTLTAGWTATIGTSSYSSPAVVNLKALGGAVVFVGGSSSFSAYPASGGAPLWTFGVSKAVDSSPAVYNGVVYFASANGTLYALDAATGALRCSFATSQFMQSSPVVVKDPDGSGAIVYDDTDPTPGPGQIFAMYAPGNTHGACKQAWTWDSWTVQPGGSFSSPGYATDADGTPVVVFGSVDPDNSVYALNAKTGAMVWTYRTNTTTANDDVGAAPTISAPGVNGFADGVAYITGKDKVTYALDLTTGKVIWQHALAIGKAGDIAGSALAGNTVYVDSDTGVYALNATTGAQIWHVLSKAGVYASPAISGPAGQQVLITANLAGNLYALSPVTGKTLWTQPGKSAYWSSPTVSQGTIYITSKNGKLLTFAPAGG